MAISIVFLTVTCVRINLSFGNNVFNMLGSLIDF